MAHPVYILIGLLQDEYFNSFLTRRYYRYLLSGNVPICHSTLSNRLCDHSLPKLCMHGMNKYDKPTF